MNLNNTLRGTEICSNNSNSDPGSAQFIKRERRKVSQEDQSNIWCRCSFWLWLQYSHVTVSQGKWNDKKGNVIDYHLSLWCPILRDKGLYLETWSGPGVITSLFTVKKRWAWASSISVWEVRGCCLWSLTRNTQYSCYPPAPQKLFPSIFLVYTCIFLWIFKTCWWRCK